MAAEQKIEVRYLVPFEGPETSIVAGDTRKIGAAEAKRLFEEGFAEPIARTKRAGAETR